jgi:hypothetical protein
VNGASRLSRRDAAGPETRARADRRRDQRIVDAAVQVGDLDLALLKDHAALTYDEQDWTDDASCYDHGQEHAEVLAPERSLVCATKGREYGQPDSGAEVQQAREHERARIRDEQLRGRCARAEQRGSREPCNGTPGRHHPSASTSSACLSSPLPARDAAAPGAVGSADA